MFLNFIEKMRKNFLFFMGILSLCAIIFLSFFSLGCEKMEARENSNLGQDVSNDESKLIAGCDPTYPVFEFMEDGSIKGFDVDIAVEIADRMGRKLEIVAIDWTETYQIAEDMEIDMVMSAVPISSDRDAVIDFSDPYFTMEYMLVVLDEIDIKTRENLKGKAVGILNIEKKYLDEDYLANYEIKGYDDVVLMIDELKNKNIDGILISLPMGVNLLTGNEGIYKVIEVVKSNEEFGIVFKEGSALREDVNKILDEIKEDGTYDEIYEKWFSYDS